LLSATAEFSSPMSKKRPLAPPASPTDEWGIYDPAKAGMQALYSRLGRPILRASAASERRQRRRAFRPERPADGVGLALQEAKRRANLLVDAATAKPAAPAPPEPVVVAPEPPAPPAPVARTARTKTAKGTKRKTTPAIVAAEPAPTPSVAAPKKAPAPAPPAAVAAPVNTPAAAPIDAPTPRKGRKPARTRQSSAPAPAREVATAAPSAPAVPPPSPRRPRGPVPLAAWAHAVHDTPRDEPKRGEAKGLWRGIFRIPSEVALVEYGRGCRIHRVVIETAADLLVESF
jgi:translation initiation factor IF-2